MKTLENDSRRDDLTALLQRSAQAAGSALSESVGWPPRAMNAEQLFEFWRGIRVVAMTTVGPQGQPHSAPVHAVLEGTTLRVLVYDNATRRRDLESNPRVSFTAWNNEGAVAILYGRAQEVAQSRRLARPAQSGSERHVIEFEVSLTRIHAMKGKEPSA